MRSPRSSGTRERGLTVRILPFVVVAAMAGIASADTVKLQYVGTGAGTSVNITGPGYSGGVFAGQLRHAFTDGTGAATAWSGTTQTTFCVEVAEYVTNSPLAYTLKDLKDVPGSPGPMGPDRAEAVQVLYDLAGGEQFQTGSAANTAAAAFQVALWELVFDFSSGDSASIDLGDGAFKLNTTGSVKTKAESWLSQIISNFGTGATQLIGLHHDSKQDQVVMVPLPAPVLMGLAGLVAVAGVRRLRK